MNNLNPKTTDESLKSHFSAFRPSSVKIMRTPNGDSRGFGFVNFFNQTDRDDSLKLNDTILNGNELIVQIKSSQPNFKSIESIKGKIMLYKKINLKKKNV